MPQTCTALTDKAKQICSNTNVNTYEDNVLSLIIFYLPSVYVQSNYTIKLMPVSVEIFRVYLKGSGFFSLYFSRCCCCFVVCFLMPVLAFTNLEYCASKRQSFSPNKTDIIHYITTLKSIHHTLDVHKAIHILNTKHAMSTSRILA